MDALADEWGVADRVGVGKLVWALWRPTADGAEHGGGRCDI
ncbi:hypothetical protein [Streptomyces niveus]|nr:hypothetical protein [Streptomyces niveus]EST25280.1 hypothetical protein M877_22390 [Streptomyces niveus NCIMB 11891]